MSEEMVIDLSEIEVLFGVIDDALQCLLHTVLFLRARQAVTPVDVECERLKPLTFPRCAGAACGYPSLLCIYPSHSTPLHVSHRRINSEETHAKVLSAIKNFKASLTRVGGAVKGVICIRFYVKTLKTNWVFQQVEDKQVFERWVLPVAVRQERSSSFSASNSESPSHSQSMGDDNRGSVEGSLDHVQRCLMDIFSVRPTQASSLLYHPC